MISLSDDLPGSVPRLDPVELGILWPVAYASVFKAPVRGDELWARMVGVRASREEMRRAIEGRTLREFVFEEDGLIWLRGAEPERLKAPFARREAVTRDLLQRHQSVLSFLSGLQGVRLAALSGGCAHGAADDGDIDVFAVTEGRALWRTLFASTLVAKALGWRRILCLNYLVDVEALTLPGRDFYSAFELISLKPFKGEEAFDELLAANPWVAPIFPNFLSSRLPGQNPPHRSRVPSPRGRLLESTARMILRPYLRYRLPDTTGVELSDHVVRLHATDHRTRVKGLFREALLNIGVEAPSWI